MRPFSPFVIRLIEALPLLVIGTLFFSFLAALYFCS